MKKILLYFVLFALAGVTAECATKTVDYNFHGQLTYVYQNNCSDSITMRSYTLYYDNPANSANVQTIEKTVGIRQGEQIALPELPYSWGGGIPRPLVWDSLGHSIGHDSTIVEMGNQRIVYRVWLGDPIYDSNEYRSLPTDSSSSDKRLLTLEWTFTDADFTDAEIIDQPNNNQ